MRTTDSTSEILHRNIVKKNDRLTRFILPSNSLQILRMSANHRNRLHRIFIDGNSNKIEGKLHVGCKETNYYTNQHERNGNRCRWFIWSKNQTKSIDEFIFIYQPMNLLSIYQSVDSVNRIMHRNIEFLKWIDGQTNMADPHDRYKNQYRWSIWSNKSNETNRMHSHAIVTLGIQLGINECFATICSISISNNVLAFVTIVVVDFYHRTNDKPW